MILDAPPTVSRLTLYRTRHAGDAAVVYEHYLANPGACTRPIESVNLGEFLRSFDDCLAWLLYDGEESPPVGHAVLGNFDWLNRCAEYGIVLRQGHQADGFGPQVTEDVLDVAFRDLGLQRVYMRVGAYNEPALRACRSFGLVEEGVLRQARWYQGRFHDQVLFSLTREEWHGRHS